MPEKHICKRIQQTVTLVYRLLTSWFTSRGFIKKEGSSLYRILLWCQTVVTAVLKSMGDAWRNTKTTKKCLGKMKGHALERTLITDFCLSLVCHCSLINNSWPDQACLVTVWGQSEVNRPSFRALPSFYGSLVQLYLQ